MSNCIWVYGCLIYLNGVPRIQEFNTLNYHTCISDTEGQFTTIKDINGRELYDGDIVGIKRGNTKYLIKWANGGFWGFDVVGSYETRMAYELHDITYLGNIHDNPELL